MRPGDFLADACESALQQWSEAEEVFRADGAAPKPFGFAPVGRLKRFVFPGVFPLHVALRTLMELNSTPPARSGFGFDDLVPALIPRRQVAEHSKPISADGQMCVCVRRQCEVCNDGTFFHARSRDDS